MAARAKTTQAKCKLCSHPRRREIDAILEERSKRRINTEETLAKLSALGVENPNLDNIKSHLGQKGNEAHTIFISEEEGEAEETVKNALRDAALAIFQRILGDNWRESTPTPEQVLEVQRSLYLHELELRIAAGLPVDITHDQALKSIGEGTKRKQNEAVDELMGGLGAALGAWATGQIEGAGAVPEVIDQEPIEEAEVKELPSG